jgi:hypothetical protein
MSEKHYPIIVAAISLSEVKIKIVWDLIEHVTFCLRFVNKATLVMEIKTLEALYLERTGKLSQTPFSNPGWKH